MAAGSAAMQQVPQVWVGWLDLHPLGYHYKGKPGGFTK